MVLRTRDKVRPIYVTIGHRVSLESAVRIVAQCVDGFRIPKPTREADHWVRDLRRAYQAGARKRLSCLKSHQSSVVSKSGQRPN